MQSAFNAKFTLKGWWHWHHQIKRRIPTGDELYGRFGNRIECAFVASVLQPEDEFPEFRAFCVELRTSGRIVTQEIAARVCWRSSTYPSAQGPDSFIGSI